MNILLLEPYCTGSHRAWAEGYARHSTHQVNLLTLPGRWWKWRMHGGAVTLARRAKAWLRRAGARPDLLLVTDMLDLTTFLALTRRWSAGIPVALYMHENQLTYPLPQNPATGPMRRNRGQRDLHYAFINYASMLAAERICFNSQFHQDDWFAALPKLLKHFPDHHEIETVAALKEKSTVLPLGLDLQRLDLAKDSDPLKPDPISPLILWNHRWEYDKGPETFFQALYALQDEGVDFQVAVCGENFRRAPAEFDRAREKLGDRILQWGRVQSFEAYASLLWRADIVVSTVLHDFFGAAVVEALYCGCRPVLPHGLAYAEHIPKSHWADSLYQEFEGLLALLRTAIEKAGPTTAGLEHPCEIGRQVARYDWETITKRYDQLFSSLGQTG